MFDGVTEELGGPCEILVRDGVIAEIAPSVQYPDGVEAIDLSERAISPGFIDTHVHLTIDASRLAAQTLESSAAKALKGLSLAHEHLHFGFTKLRDLGSMDPEFGLRCTQAMSYRRAARPICRCHLGGSGGGSW